MAHEDVPKSYSSIVTAKIKALLAKAETQKLSEEETREIEEASKQLELRKQFLSKEISSLNSRATTIRTNELVHIKTYRTVLETALKETIKNSAE